jgi:hypothetical protein
MSKYEFTRQSWRNNESINEKWINELAIPILNINKNNFFSFVE